MNYFLSNFPYCRPRRLRQEDWIRQIVTENFLKISDLILPIFLTYEARSTEIDMMPDVKRNNINDAVLLANKAYEAGIKAVAIFPEVPEEKKDVEKSSSKSEKSNTDDKDNAPVIDNAGKEADTSKKNSETKAPSDSDSQ